MSHYQHTKGQIKDNAIEALLHDPLFRQRVEKNKKGKGSYLRKNKHAKRGNWEASGKQANRLLYIPNSERKKCELHHEQLRPQQR